MTLVVGGGGVGGRVEKSGEPKEDLVRMGAVSYVWLVKRPG